MPLAHGSPSDAICASALRCCTGLSSWDRGAPTVPASGRRADHLFGCSRRSSRTFRACATITSCPSCGQQPADPGRMGPCLQSHSAARHPAEYLLHRFGVVGSFCSTITSPCFVQDAVARGSISQVHSDRQLLLLENFLTIPARCYSFS